MKLRLPRFALVALFALCSLPALASDWRVESEGSRLDFVAEYSEGPIDGRFNRFNPAIRFDATALESARFDVEIDLASVSTGDEEWDGYLRGEEFFNTEGFPKARFLAERFEASEGGYIAHGTLELRGVQQPVALRFSFEVNGDSAVLRGEAELDRMAFGVGSGDWADADTIAHAVKVRTELKLTR